jgi:hypothetical protein
MFRGLLGNGRVDTFSKVEDWRRLAVEARDDDDKSGLFPACSSRYDR